MNILLFGLFAVVLAGAQFRIDGQLIQSPTDIVAAIPDTLFLVLASLALLIVTVAVNIMANFVAPVYVLTNLAPNLLNFRRAGLISATIAVLILPWHLYNSPGVILYFLGGLGALLGPLYGIIMVDYHLVRKGRVNLPELYTESRAGAYHYAGGVNPRAIAAFVPAAIISTLLALLPAFAELSPFSWFFGAGLAGLIHYAPGQAPHGLPRSFRRSDRGGQRAALTDTWPAWARHLPRPAVAPAILPRSHPAPGTTARRGPPRPPLQRREDQPGARGGELFRQSVGAQRTLDAGVPGAERPAAFSVHRGQLGVDAQAGGKHRAGLFETRMLQPATQGRGELAEDVARMGAWVPARSRKDATSSATKPIAALAICGLPSGK